MPEQSDCPNPKVIPCPNCGNTPKLLSVGDAIYAIICEKCDKIVSWRFSKEDAIKEWNKEVKEEKP